MLYHLFQYLESFDFPGAGVFQYITFRSACAIILSLIIATVVGKRVIRMLQRQQIGECLYPTDDYFDNMVGIDRFRR